MAMSETKRFKIEALHNAIAIDSEIYPNVLYFVNQTGWGIHTEKNGSLTGDWSNIDLIQELLDVLKLHKR